MSIGEDIPQQLDKKFMNQFTKMPGLVQDLA